MPARPAAEAARSPLPPLAAADPNWSYLLLVSLSSCQRGIGAERDGEGEGAGPFTVAALPPVQVVYRTGRGMHPHTAPPQGSFTQFSHQTK